MSNNGNVIPFGKSARELPEEAYTESSIGSSLITFFQQSKLTRNEGLAILEGIHGYLENGSSEDDNAQRYIASFTDHGATHVEVLAGVTWVLEAMVDIDAAVVTQIQQEMTGDDDESTLH